MSDLQYCENCHGLFEKRYDKVTDLCKECEEELITKLAIEWSKDECIHQDSPNNDLTN